MHCLTQDIKVGSLELSASQASEGSLQAGQIFGLLRSCLSWNHRSSRLDQSLPPLCELVHAEAAAFVNILPNATLPSTARNRAV